MNQRNNAKHNKNNPHHKTNNNVNPKNGKNAKKGKGQNNGSQQDSQIVALNKPILSFGCAEEHKEVPASNFQSKSKQNFLYSLFSWRLYTEIVVCIDITSTLKSY